MKVNIKRLIAGIMSIMLVITVINFREIIKIGASEVSGYKIDVTYSEDNSIATLTGNTQEVKSDVQLKTLTDANGSEFVPQEFKQEINKNGEYKFILNYTQTIGESVQEKQQEITVKIDGIMSGIEYIPNPFSSTENPTEEQPAVETPAEEQPQTPAETPVEAPQVSDENSDFPDKLPISVLRENLMRMSTGIDARSGVSTYASKNPTINYKAVTAENQVVLTEVGNNGVGTFAGGLFSDSNILSIPGRAFNRGIYVTGTTQHIITGLFPHYDGGQLKWYYTTNSNGLTPNYGFIMPDDAEVWVEYKVTGTTDYNISSNFYPTSESYNTTYWNLTYKTTAKEKEKIVFEINLPAEYVGAKIDIKNGGYSVAKFKIGNPSNAGEFTALDMINPDLKRYSGMFDMPNFNVEIQVWAEKYSGGPTKYYGVGLNADILSMDPQSDSECAEIKFQGKTDRMPTVYNRYVEVRNSVTFPYSGGQLDYTHGNGVSPNITSTPFYNNDGTTTNQKVAWGMFTIGDTVEIDMQFTKYHKYRDNPISWKKIPIALRLDTYSEDITSPQTMTSEIIELPTYKYGQTETFLPSGAKVTVTCNNYAEDWTITGSESLGPAYKGQGKGKGANFAYNIKVENMPYAFKTYLMTETESQNPIQSKISGSGIQKGTGEGNKTSNGNQDTFTLKGNIQGSFYIAGRDDVTNNERKAYPLTESLSMWAKYGRNATISREDGSFEFYIKVDEGYNEPSVSVTDPNKLVSKSIKNGYYHYKYIGLGADSFLNWSTEPITFKMTYRDGKNHTYTDTDTKLYAPTTKKEYALYQPKDLKSPYDESAAQKEYFKGFKIIYPKSDGSTVDLLSGQIFKVGQTIDLQKIYDELRNSNLLDKSKTEYEIYIAAQWDTNAVEDTLITTTYNITKQTKIGNFAIDVNVDKPTTIEELKTRYIDVKDNTEKGKFSRTPKDVKAYVGSTGRLVGYEEMLPEDGTKRKYILSPESIFDGDVTLDSAFAELVYMYAVNVQFEMNPANGDSYSDSFGNGNSFGNSQDELNTFNDNIKDRYYTPANNYSVDGGSIGNGNRLWALELFTGANTYNTLYNPGTINGKKFVGWKVKTSTGIDWVIDGKQGGVQWLNFYDIATQQSTLWEEAVNNGTITLMPVWEVPYGPITTNNTDSSISDENNFDNASKAIVTYTGNGYDVSATFKYTGDWNLQKEKVKVALFKKDKGSIFDTLWVTESGVTDNGKVTVSGGTKEDKVKFDINSTDYVKVTPGTNGGTVTFTFKILEVSENESIYPIIQERWDNGAQWTIYAWNDKNGYTDYHDNVKNQWGLTGTDKKVPAARYKSVVYPAPITDENGNMVGDPLEVEFKEGDEFFTLTAKFKIDKWYAFDQMWGTSGQTIGNNIDENKKINLALYKQNPGTNQPFVLWDTEKNDGQPETHKNKVADPTVTNNNGIITVTWNIINDNGSVNYTWDHNAKYRIYAYNAQNANYKETPDSQYSNTSDWPSVTTTTKMIYQEPQYYVSVPKYVSMSDEATGDKASGTGEVTYKTFDPVDLVTQFPYIRVEMESPIVLDPYEYDGTEISGENSINPSVYRKDEVQTAKEYTSADDSKKYIVLGILADDGSTTGYPHTNPGYGTVPAGRELGFTLKTNKVLDKKILYQGSIQYRFTILEVIDS